MFLKKFNSSNFKAYLLFIGAGAGAGKKNNPEPVKNRPAPQHWRQLHLNIEYYHYR